VIVDHNQKNQARAPLDFKEVKVFSDPESHLAVRIVAAKTERGDFKYKRETGEVGDTDGHERFFRGHRTFWDTQDRRVVIREPNFQVFEALWQAAGEYIRNEIQVDRDEEDARRKNQGPPQRPGLKNLAKQDKARRAG
jgi:hypothetical protein